MFISALCGNIFAQKTDKASIKTETDSVSYAYGAGLAQEGLQQYMQQLGIIADTEAVRTSYETNIAIEANPAKKSNLEKEMQFKLDSINKANKKNLNLFIDGITARFNTKESNSSYFDGIAIGDQLTKMIPPFSEQLYGENKKDEINKNLVLLGLVTALKGEKLLIDDTYNLIERKMTTAQAKLEKEREENLKGQHTDEIAKGERFFKENNNRPGVVSLPTGLQYEIITKGTGAKPNINDRVKVHYRGSLLDGTVFDSSIDRGEPAVFEVGRVISGWTEALQLMPVGSKWMLFIPYDLAYGSRGAGNTIKPFSALIFEVELLGIE